MPTTTPPEPTKAKVAIWSELADRRPAYALVAGVDLVVIRYDDRVSVLYGRCLHRGALLADGRIEGHNLICGLHDWDYRLDTGVSEYHNEEALQRFDAWVDPVDDAVYVDENEVAGWVDNHPQPYDRETYLGLYADVHGAPEGPFNRHIRTLAKGRVGHHGPVSAMGVPLTELPRWDGLQLLTAQLARKPLLDDTEVGSELVIGPNARRPLRLDIPIFVSDMSFGALSQEAKIALAMGADLAGTGICSGEAAISPSRFPDLETPEDFRRVADEVREVSGGIPIGFKLSAQHIEADLDVALEVGIDYLILDGRGGGTGAAPALFKDNISVPTIPALARARRHLDAKRADEVALIITGGLRTEADFFKALALGADGVAVANAAIQAIGCLGMRACHTNNCPVGIATQRDHLRARLIVERSAQQLHSYLSATVDLMKVADPGLWARPPERLLGERSDHLGSRASTVDRGSLRRGNPARLATGRQPTSSSSSGSGSVRSSTTTSAPASRSDAADQRPVATANARQPLAWAQSISRGVSPMTITRSGGTSKPCSSR